MRVQIPPYYVIDFKIFHYDRKLYKKKNMTMPLTLLDFSSLLYFLFLLRNETIHPHTNTANLFLTSVEKQFCGERIVFSASGAGAMHTDIHK